MVLIDSSVWVDYLGGSNTPQSNLLARYLAERWPIATTGVILQELLQGTRDVRQVLANRLSRLNYLRADKRTHIRAADIHRKARACGTTIPTADALIAATAIEHGASILTSDRAHFEAIAKVSKLEIVRR